MGNRVGMEKLKDTDLVWTIRNFENGEVSTKYLLHVIKTTTETYNAKYVTDLLKEIIGNPQNPRFKLRHNQPMFARYGIIYVGKMYESTGKQEFLDFILGYINHSDKIISTEAIKRLKRIIGEKGTERVLNEEQDLV